MTKWTAAVWKSIDWRKHDVSASIAIVIAGAIFVVVGGYAIFFPRAGRFPSVGHVEQGVFVLTV